MKLQRSKEHLSIDMEQLEIREIAHKMKDDPSYVCLFQDGNGMIHSSDDFICAQATDCISHCDPKKRDDSTHPLNRLARRERV